MQEDALARFKQLTEVDLPARARAERWPLRFDHCFKRVCLDHAFQDVWYRHLKKPAETHIAGEPLRRAVACAEAIADGGAPVLRQRNAESLAWRGKHGLATPGLAGLGEGGLQPRPGTARRSARGQDVKN